MRIGSLFSGAGGLDLAVEHVFGATTAWHCEIDPAASKVLTHRWPGVPNLGDITQVDFGAVAVHVVGWDFEPIDILCGGFPCQDVSAAGRRAGIREGTRSGLWAIFADTIAALRPPIVIVENVRGLLSARAHRAMERNDPIMGNSADGPILRAAGAVLGDLADLGYDAQWTTIAASDIRAPHRRERIFILATNTESKRWTGRNKPWPHLVSDGPQLAHPDSQRGTASDSACDGRHERRTQPTRLKRGSDAPLSSTGHVELLPTPSADRYGYNQSPSPGAAVRYGLDSIDKLLPTPEAKNAHANGGHLNRSGARKDEPLLPGQAREMATAWGKYEPAIRRWEQLTRPAPAPTEPNTKGNPRLAAQFSEWMMGWPAGWVTTVPGISRNDALRIIGNGVVPQQATAALQWLLNVSEVAA